jgi:preprotein translocase subunit SecG
MAAFGARGATTLLHKLTVGAFVIFTLTTLSIAILQGRPSGTSVMKGAKPAASAPAPAPAQPPASQPETPAQTPPPAPAPAETPAPPPAQ